MLNLNDFACSVWLHWTAAFNSETVKNQILHDERRRYGKKQTGSKITRYSLPKMISNKHLTWVENRVKTADI